MPQRKRRRSGLHCSKGDRLHPDHHLSFMDNGVQVRIRLPESTQGNLEYLQKFFTYSQYKDSWLRARDAARRWRDREGTNVWGEAWPDVEAATRYAPHKKISQHNTSGEPGVSFDPRSGGKWFGYWREGKPPNRKTRRRYFSVEKYGFDEAKRLATIAREQGVFKDSQDRKIWQQPQN